MDFAFPEFHGLMKHVDLPIGLLRHKRSLYENFPAFQREKIWSLKMRQSLIDSIIREYPIPELLANHKGGYYFIVDGRQRLSTVLDFLVDGFPTAHLREDPCLQPIEPKKRYSELPDEIRARIDNYTLRLGIIPDMDESELGALFRRLQHQQPLILAEKLWTFSSHSKHYAEKLAEHPFWQSMYSGKKERRRTFLASLHLIGLELSAGTITLNVNSLRTIAAGIRDEEITEKHLSIMQQRLAFIEGLYRGTIIHSMKELIPLYQSVILLDQQGCDITQSEEGCLSGWFSRVKSESLEARTIPGETDLFAKILYGRGQTDFWNRELPLLKKTPGLRFIDPKRSFSVIDREQAFARQNGLCPFCSQPISLSDIGHHIILHSKGGPTTAENCMILHDVCHERLHSLLPDTEWERFKAS